jgi:hypothetical protein
MRRVRIIGLALVAVFALSAVAAASASAFTTFEATEYPATIKAEQKEENVFQIGTEATGKVTCKKATFEGTAAGPTEVITVHPVYSECTVFTVVGGTVTTEGCNYEVFASGKVNVKCTLGKTIIVKAGTCEVKVGSQVGLEHLTYVNLAGPPTTVEIKDEVSKIAYTSNKDVTCPAEKLEATYKGSELAKGFNGSGTQIGIKVK